MRIGLAIGVALLALSQPAHAQKIVAAGEWSLEGFKGEKNLDNAISGLACLGPGGSQRRCLLVNDEMVYAQWGLLSGRRIVAAGKRVRLVGEDAPTPLGAPPDISSCPDNGKPNEFDGEAVALDAKHFYVVGSHGCGRNSGKGKISAFLVARIPVASFGTSKNVATSHRLADVLHAHPDLKAHFAQQLQNGEGLPVKADPNGLNIEGAAIVGGRLLVGLRAPVVAGNAFILSVVADALFDAAADPQPQLIRLDLGGQGVRELIPDARGNLLLVAGPPRGEGGAFELFSVAPDGRGKRSFGVLPAGAGGDVKAEGMLLLGRDDKSMRVLVTYDGKANARPREFIVND